MKFIMLLLFISIAAFGTMNSSLVFHADSHTEKNIEILDSKVDHNDCDDSDEIGDKTALLSTSLFDFHSTCKHFLQHNNIHYEDERFFLPLQPPDHSFFI